MYPQGRIGSITRCNQNSNYWLTYSNEGTTINDGQVCLTPSELTTFISADPPVDVTVEGEICWNYENLYPMNSNQIHLVFEMPDFNFIGEQIDFSASIKTNDDQGMDATELSSELVCAYDPNDKQVSPAGQDEEGYTLFGDTLTYTIRFQNTGNDTAFNVVIKDNLSQYLDLKTFKPISSSHPMSTQLDIETGIVEFTFNDIYLPDSFVNEPASHGFIKYEILHNENLDENTDITNEAFIFYDFNPAIVTNTVSNRMVSMIPTALVSIEEQRINLYPNPSDGNFILKSDFNKIDAVKIYNSHGAIVYQDKDLNNWTNIKLNNFSKGIHIVHLMVDGQVYVRKIVVQW